MYANTDVEENEIIAKAEANNPELLGYKIMRII